MGTDIYLFVEQRTEQGWRLAQDPIPAHHIDAFFDFIKEPVPQAVDLARASNFFAVLAGVSNGKFGHFTPISLDRGLPEDVNEAGRRLHEQWPAQNTLGVGYVYGDELAQYPWENPVTLTAVVEPDIAHLFDSAQGWPQNVERKFALSAVPGTRVSWTERCDEATNWAYHRQLLEPFGLTRSIRFVFWFH